MTTTHAWNCGATTLSGARDITDFMLAACCTNCQRVLSRGSADRADLDEMVVALLSTRPRACPEPADVREERVFSTLCALGLAGAGMAVGFFWRYVMNLLGGIR